MGTRALPHCCRGEQRNEAYDMSRAFVKEVEQEVEDLPDRPVSAHPNLVTAEGLGAIERAIGRYEAENQAALAKNDRIAIAASQRELQYWNARRSSAQVVEPGADKNKTVRCNSDRPAGRWPNPNVSHRW